MRREDEVREEAGLLLGVDRARLIYYRVGLKPGKIAEDCRPNGTIT